MSKSGSRFATQYDDHPRVHVNPGVRVKTLYGPIFDDRGVMHLTEIGKHNLYAEIQSHAQSVDIHVLLKRFEAGDVEALSRIQGTYGDFTQMPTTFAEALNTMIAAEQYFLSLPVEVRAKYGHDFNRFITSMDAPGFAQDIGLVPFDASSVPPGPVSSAAPGTTPLASSSSSTPATPPSADQSTPPIPQTPPVPSSS